MEDQRIRKLRSQLGLSQERFARLLGVSLQTVRRWEAGLSRPLPIISVKLEELQREVRATAPKEGGVPMAKKEKGAEARVEVGLGGLFKGIGGLLDIISEMAEEGKEEYVRFGEKTATGGKVKGVYGISVRLGLGGKPVIEQFGNIRATERGAEVAEVREPLVDVFDEGELLVLIAELPGVEAEAIHVEVKEDVLVLTAEGKDRKYSKEILLPSPVEADTMVSSYKNGILELRLAKKR